ncbi:hypothetical protein [Bradyrhizobium sp. LMTR 3]|uniref:hypothetical protein n=1 Tax=Bradyrhizobium sp. LMTR 3 TaxID=189873 RepID=UPI0008103AAA|nr:hypothetical protein [Bradyrhizobium sp. LMTR 3]OCK55424.1 hypothetical protein LMTR3_11455 [Bradyrhizobium sp. LMTR 3]
MSDQQSQPASGETVILGAGPAAPGMPAPGAPAAASDDVETTRVSPDQEETSPKPDAREPETIEIEAPIPEASGGEAPPVDAGKQEAPRFSGNVTILLPGDRLGADAKSGSAEPSPGKRRFGAVAAVLVASTIAGAFGGALATAGIGKLITVETASGAPAKGHPLEGFAARIDADIATLKRSIEHAAEGDINRSNRAGDRLDKIERAQADSATKLAKLSETVEKLRAAQASATMAAAAPAPVKDVNGLIPTAAARSPLTSPKPEIARLPTVEGWVLRDVVNGSALIESRGGIYEVYAGDPVPGLGRVDAIRKQDGRWVVITSKGLILSR